jgi:hypothetical protein
MDFSARATTKDVASGRRRRSCTPPRFSSTLPRRKAYRPGRRSQPTTPSATPTTSRSAALLGHDCAGHRQHRVRRIVNDVGVHVCFASCESLDLQQCGGAPRFLKRKKPPSQIRNGKSLRASGGMACVLFDKYQRDRPEHLLDAYISRWHRAAAVISPEKPLGNKRARFGPSRCCASRWVRN